jgi:hypothetical protein
MASVKEIRSLDTTIQPAMDSWSSPPEGILLLIQERPPDDFFLLLDDSGNRLLTA